MVGSVVVGKFKLSKAIFEGSFIASSSNAWGVCDREVLATKHNQALRVKAPPTFARLQPLAPAAKYVRVAHQTALR